MRFSIYSEIQYWGGKPPKRAYDEVIEQVVHADRLGYDAYAVIEHFFFPKFSISANPFALWGECAARTTTYSASLTAVPVTRVARATAAATGLAAGAPA